LELFIVWNYEFINNDVLRNEKRHLKSGTKKKYLSICGLVKKYYKKNARKIKSTIKIEMDPFKNKIK
jgi:hypothetical protein